ncbi:MAG TPA: HEAT repeat domain-containing protein [Phycisphaerae bacterium]|nr:HEAT repeat domain-containing protein [Phycisphaerae bacterium]HNU44972.1 HEAT repeat domain-containing protein [Phycisphaerae bacterium]
MALCTCLTGVVLSVPAGCRTAPRVPPQSDVTAARGQALACLRLGVQYRHNPAVRAEAVEAYETVAGDEGLPWLRLALLDDHPAVRFAACVVLGVRQDRVALAALQQRLDDADPSVRVAARFALHRLGDDRRTGEIPTYLLDHEDAAVRRNAALVLGRFAPPEKPNQPSGLVKVLAKAMRDRDPGVQQHALEAMARLGLPEARQQLRFLANSGVGAEEVFALNALAETRDRSCAELFRSKLATATHIETRLAAARGLGLLGFDDGLGLAVQATRYSQPRRDEPDDPPGQQILRVRQLALVALGGIGSPAALPTLTQVMHDNSDPRVQVAAARAILEITDREAKSIAFAS